MKRRWTTAWIAAMAATLLSTPASATIFITDDGYRFDIHDGHEGAFDVADGVIYRGGEDGSENYAFEGAGCYTLRVSGSDYRSPSPGTVDGQTVHLAPMTVGSIEVERHIHVPASGNNYVRYYDIFRNVGTEVASINIGYGCDLASQAYTHVWDTGSGDVSLDTSDTWFGTDDIDGTEDPTLAHVFFGEGASVRPASQQVVTGAITTNFAFDVVPGESVAIMFFGFQGPSQAQVSFEVADLLSDPYAAVTDITHDDLIDVRNWSLAGAPVIGWADGQQFTVAEGGNLEMMVVIDDPEGDTTTTTWDLDGDGVYESSGETVTLSASGIDGPSQMIVAVQSTDGENVATISADVTVENAPPVFAGAADHTLSIGREWTYAPEVTDPGFDDFDINVLDFPAGVEVTGGAFLRWVPLAEDVGVHEVSFEAIDDDSARALHTIRLLVQEGEPLAAPVIIAPSAGDEIQDLRPTIQVENPEDLSGELDINFEMDTESSFPNPISSGAVPAGAIVAGGNTFFPHEPDGTTSWTVDEDLEDGIHYFVRVWASDPYGEGEAATTHFWIVLGDDECAEGEDCDDTDEPVGCKCGAAPSAGAAPAAGLFLVVGLVLAALRRR